jgi:predicted  nucleic acid-binding Zn-ribbon protein
MVKEELRTLKENKYMAYSNLKFSLKLQDEIIKMSKNSATLEEQLSQKDFRIEELKKSNVKLQEAERRMEKYVEKNKLLKNTRDDLKDQIDSVCFFYFNL